MRTTTYSRLAAALTPAALLFTAGTANAATCEEAFVKKGNPITGLRFTAAVTIADLPPAVAIGWRTESGTIATPAGSVPAGLGASETSP